MSINFNANQYEQAFTPHRTQNWEVPKNVVGKYPNTNTGFTRIKANDRGHLLPNVPHERSSPWGTFVGTWDLPHKIQGNRVKNPTARTEDAVLKGAILKDKGDDVIKGHLKKCRTVHPLPIKMDAPDNQVPVGMICQPAYGAAQGMPYEPCIQVETTHDDTNQPRALSRKSQQEHKWPQAKSPACQSPVGHAQSPKPITPMAVANFDVFAPRMVSPLTHKTNRAEIGGHNTHDASLQECSDKPRTPQDRNAGMKSPTSVVQDKGNAHVEAALKC